MKEKIEQIFDDYKMFTHIDGRVVLTKQNGAVISEEELDLFVCEMAHFNTEHIRPYIENCKAKKIAFTHVFPLAKYEKIAQMSGELTIPVITPKDNDTIEI